MAELVEYRAEVVRALAVVHVVVVRERVVPLLVEALVMLA